jgi:hypothetical protein
VTGLRLFHRPSVHHRRVALPLPLPLLLRLGYSPLLCKVNSRECLHCSWSDRVWPKPKCVGPVRSSKIKKIQKQFLIYCVLLTKIVFNINQCHYIITLKGDRIMT